MKAFVRSFGLAILVLFLIAGSAATQEATPDGSPAAASGGRAIDLPHARILALSPDGKWIAAGTPSDGTPDHLCIYSVETLKQQSCADLSELKAGLRQEDVVWSPDSMQLAFGENSFKYLVDGDLWMMDAASGKLTDLTDDGFDKELPLLDKDNLPKTPIYVDILPAWSPDGRSITFSRSPIINGETKGNQIARIDLESGNITTLVPVTLDQPGIVYYGLTWAPDGQHLYYSIMYPDMKNPDNGVWVYDTAGGTATQLLRSDPKLGPPAIMEINATGDTGLVFYPIAASQFGPSGQFYALLDLQSGKTLPIDPNLQDKTGTQLAAGTFSPDGARVLYTLNSPSNGGQLLIRDLHGDEAVTVVDWLPKATPLLFGRGLTWATNGTTLVLTDISKGVLIPLGADHSTPPPAATSPTTPSPTASPTSSGFTPDQIVTLTAEAALHATPSDQGQVVLNLRPGAHLIVIGEPAPSGDQTWVPVVEPATGTLGYVDAALVR
jgi:Tol biopolymer transport system component